MNVYDWCSKLHKLKDELKASGEKERVTTIRVESVEDFKEACSKVGASCEIRICSRKSLASWWKLLCGEEDDQNKVQTRLNKNMNINVTHVTNETLHCCVV
jgi:hypothetical protein